MVRYKTEKYLIRAEKIHNMYLSTEMKNLKQLVKARLPIIKSQYIIFRQKLKLLVNMMKAAYNDQYQIYTIIK